MSRSSSCNDLEEETAFYTWYLSHAHGTIIAELSVPTILAAAENPSSQSLSEYLPIVRQPSFNTPVATILIRSLTSCLEYIHFPFICMSLVMIALTGMLFPFETPHKDNASRMSQSKNTTLKMSRASSLWW